VIEPQSITEAVPFSDVVARVSDLEAIVASSLGQAPPTQAPVTGASFATTLSAATAQGTPGSSASALVSAAQSQVGQAEQPPGSNDGAAVATYRTAVQGAEEGQPWCADFVSWAAAQAGKPLGDAGQGLGSVSEIASWAQRTGRYLPAGTAPQPGDLILFGTEHVGLVESVNPDGSLTTIEGNYENAVTRVHRMPGEATGYVRV